MDDRNIDHADQREQRAGARRAPWVVNGCLQGHEAEIQEEQQQFGGQTRVPCPPGAPHRFSQSEPVTSASSVNEAPIGAEAVAAISASRMFQIRPMAPAEAITMYHEHGHPGGRHVDEHDAHAFTLLVVGRRDE